VRTLTVTGSGSAAAVPDAAVVRVAAVREATSLVDALAGADSAARVVGEVARRHVDAVDVATQSVNVWPAHDAKGRPSGFQARHGLTIRCADLETAGTLLGELAETLGDRLQVDSVSTLVTDSSQAQAEARELAFLDARARAEHLARLADAARGAVESVGEGGGAGAPAVRFLAQDAAKLSVGLEPGQSEITATVTVTWQLV
jgi:uncharacterized protein YggE